jgi:hypothetical protein
MRRKFEVDRGAVGLGEFPFLKRERRDPPSSLRGHFTSNSLTKGATLHRAEQDGEARPRLSIHTQILPHPRARWPATDALPDSQGCEVRMWSWPK